MANAGPECKFKVKIKVNEEIEKMKSENVRLKEKDVQTSRRT